MSMFTWISGEYLQLALILIGPLIVRKLLTIWNSRQRQSKQSFKKRSSHTHADTILALIHIIAIIYQLFQLLPSQPNMFNRGDDGIYINSDPLASDKWIINHLASNPHKLNDGEKFLKSRLRSRTSRCLYSKFGPEIFEACKWCREENDYLWFILPIIVSAYTIEMIFIGLSTSSFIRKVKSNGKSHQTRKYISIILICLFAIEVFGWTMEKAENQTPLRGYVIQFPYINANYFRRLSFSALHVLLLIKHFIYDMTFEGEENDQNSDFISLMSIVNHMEMYALRSKAITLSRFAIWRDKSLRDKVVDYFQSIEEKDKSIKLDPVYIDAIQASGMNVEETERQAEQFITGIIEGILQQSNSSNSSDNSVNT